MINVFLDVSSDDSDNELMDFADMEHYRLQLERIFMHHRAQQRDPAQLHQPHQQTLMEHRCLYCESRLLYFDGNPQSQFRCTSLKQSILLNFGRNLYDNPNMVKVLAAYPLPHQLKANIRQVVEEMKAWLAENERFEENRGTGVPSLFRCFLCDVHWLPISGTRQIVAIDRTATAKMILQANRTIYPFAGNALRSGACEFLLAASNCLEEEVNRLWPLIDIRIREQWLGTEVLYGNPVISYWVAKCANHMNSIARSLERVVMYCVDKENTELLRYFWPKVNEILAAKLPYMYDHTFHTAIDKGNRSALYFLWHEAPPAGHASMISSANCCGTRNAYHAFVVAVSKGHFDIVEFLWNNTSDEQHNGMLLADHSAAFCTAAAKGYDQIVKLLWLKSTKNQRFVLLYEGNCAAFRDACSEGHLDVVQILWSSVDDQQRSQLLTVGQNMSFIAACQHGQVDVLKYLFDNMNSNMKQFLIDSNLPRAVSVAALHCRAKVLRFLKSVSTPLQYKRALFADDLISVHYMLKNWRNSQRHLVHHQHQHQEHSCANDSPTASPFIDQSPSADWNRDDFWYREAVGFLKSLKKPQDFELALSYLPDWFRTEFLHDSAQSTPVSVLSSSSAAIVDKFENNDPADVDMIDNGADDGRSTMDHSSAETSDNDDTFFESWFV